MSTVISVENVSKQYRLGEVGTGSLAHDVNRWWHRIRGNEDPYLKVGEANDRSKKGDSDYSWALRDVSFEVKQGEVLGIIGRNGAGKSTLLKILSRVTRPTTGEIKVRGRIASLLEVGTGFHPELSGRENIFLNGAILGMRKDEIRQKFDEIVDFSGCERYIDTPVKRYSSGMYVRLAFAVAAHLEPEILIVDEVLAVGDAEFQRKCLGKMKEVAQDGRTVLFVSHNMGAVANLCNSAIILTNGTCGDIIPAKTAVAYYYEKTFAACEYTESAINTRIGNGNARVTNVQVFTESEQESGALLTGMPLTMQIDYSLARENCSMEILVTLNTNDGNKLTRLDTPLTGFSIKAPVGARTARCRLSDCPFPPGKYRAAIDILLDGKLADQVPNAVEFTILGSALFSSRVGSSTEGCAVLVRHQWEDMSATSPPVKQLGKVR